MRTVKLGFAAILFAATLFSASQVRADGTDYYTYVADGNTFTWQLPSQPVVKPVNVEPGQAFTLDHVTVIENGLTLVGEMDFYNINDPGGFDFWINNPANPIVYINAFGPQLYSGPESAPTMLTGTFSFADYGNDGDPNTPAPYTGTLHVTGVTEAPEPSALLLVLIGGMLTMAAFVLRRN
jgi:hypothetical protein